MHVLTNDKSPALGRNEGFTVIELLVVIVAISILATIGILSTNGYREKSRDSERLSDIDVISRNLERYYRTSPTSSGASYPNNGISATSLAAIIGNSDATTAPNQTGNSLVLASSAGAQNPTISQYVYQPLNLDGSVCTANPCVRYQLYYRLESTNVVGSVTSLRQQ